jgi:hypothetical protein
MDAELRKLEYSEFCRRLGRTLRSTPEKTGNTRYDLTLKIAAEPTYNVAPRYHPAIKKREPAVGMTVCALLAAIGPADTVNRTVNARGESHQLVYRNPTRYVYLDNFIVTGWQDQP